MIKNSIMKISRKEFHKIPYGQRNGIYEVKDFGTLYYVNDKLHRLDGPAIEYSNGEKFYCIEDERYSSKDEFDKQVRIIKMRNDSGNFTSNDLITSFIYTLARDHLPIGIIEEILSTCDNEKCLYTNGWLAKYAEEVSKKLHK